MTATEEPQKLHVTLITGLSGAGKSEAVATSRTPGTSASTTCRRRCSPTWCNSFGLEGNKINRVALVFDARGGTHFEELGEALEYLRASDISFKVLYLEADDEQLVARTRPRGVHIRSRGIFLEGIELERRLLLPLRVMADIVIDTTRLSPWSFRRRLEEVLLADRLSDQLLVSLESFAIALDCPARPTSY